MKESKLTPRIAETAKGLWLVYLGITVACALAYRWAGMNGFDAVIHAFTTMGLGGFSSHDASFAFWDSPRIEAVAIVFMHAYRYPEHEQQVAALARRVRTFRALQTAKVLKDRV